MLHRASKCKLTLVYMYRTKEAGKNPYIKILFNFRTKNIKIATHLQAIKLYFTTCTEKVLFGTNKVFTEIKLRSWIQTHLLLLLSTSGFPPNSSSVGRIKPLVSIMDDAGQGSPVWMIATAYRGSKRNNHEMLTSDKRY